MSVAAPPILPANATSSARHPLVGDDVDAPAADPVGTASEASPTPTGAIGFMRARYRAYSHVGKLRLNTLVVLTTAVGLALGAHTLTGAAAPLLVWIGTLLGTGLTAFGSAIFNCLLEVPQDQQMRRTRLRAFVTGEISNTEGILVGSLASVAGLAIVAATANPLTTALVLATWVLYVGVYTPLKTRSLLSTIVGAVVGAIPPMIGVAAVTGAMPAVGWLLGGILFVWQIPHFLALAWLCREDYTRASYRMLSVGDKDGRRTAAQALIWTVALLPLTLLATPLGIAGTVFFIGASILNLGFLGLAIRFTRDRSTIAARRLFLASVLYLPAVLGLMVADAAPIIG